MSWRATRLKFLAAMPIRNGLGESGSQVEPSWPRYIRTTDIAGPRTLRSDVFASLPPDIAGSAMLQRGDIVMTAAGATIGKTLLYNLDLPACYAGYLVRFRPKPDVDVRFIAYWMESRSYWDQIQADKVVSTIENFSASKYQNLRLSLPDNTSQRAIADYLDTETARIDALIEKKRQMIGLLEERATAEIASIFATIGDALPPGWERVRARYLCPEITVGVVVDPSSYFVDEGVPFIHGTDVRRGWIDESAFKFLTAESNDLLRKSRLHAGDVIAMRVGEPGRAAVVPPHLEGANAASVLIFRESPKLASDLLSGFLNSPVGRSQIESMQYGAAQGVLNVTHALDLCIPVAPLASQPRLARQLSKVSDRTRTAGTFLQRQIGLLQEHRQALITAAVTGELAVPGVAA